MTDNTQDQSASSSDPALRVPESAVSILREGVSFFHSLSEEDRDDFLTRLVSATHLYPSLYGSETRRLADEKGWSPRTAMSAYSTFFFLLSRISYEEDTEERREQLIESGHGQWIEEEHEAVVRWLADWIRDHRETSLRWLGLSDLPSRVTRLLHEATFETDMKFFLDTDTPTAIPFLALVLETGEEDRTEFKLAPSQVEALLKDLEKGLKDLRRARQMVSGTTTE